MSAPIADRWRLTLPLTVPALGGLVYLAAFGAPAQLIAVNAGALTAALLWVLWGRLPARPGARLGLAASGATLLFLPLLTGPEVGGVSSWLPAGPVLVHSGALLLPLAVVLAAQATRLGPAVLALAATALAMQPDAAMLAGLAAASTVLAGFRRSAGFALVAAAGAGLAALTFGSGTLEPQRFTEGVLAQVWQSAPLAALSLAAMLFIAAPALLLRSAHRTGPDALALSALLVTLGAMACLASFPFPLIAYGASPILGFGLALGATQAVRQL